ncbi:MAG: DUF2155 domain-containing protein [Hyphomicrobiaceae bacterium]|nr:DUF2155 domain-containing protein [Hyphomicrobiaceae bacterium]
MRAFLLSSGWRQLGLLLPAVACAVVIMVSAAGSVLAERLANDVAVFAALDKVTARISKIEVPLNQTKVFGSLKVTPRVCFSRPPTEQPKTTSFVEVDEVMIDGTQKRLFSGWMFAESPGLNAVEHPVFDVWLTGCKSSRTVASKHQKTTPGRAEEPEEEPRPRRRRRVRR